MLALIYQQEIVHLKLVNHMEFISAKTSKIEIIVSSQTDFFGAAHTRDQSSWIRSILRSPCFPLSPCSPPPSPPPPPIYAKQRNNDMVFKLVSVVAIYRQHFSCDTVPTFDLTCFLLILINPCSSMYLHSYFHSLCSYFVN